MLKIDSIPQISQQRYYQVILYQRIPVVKVNTVCWTTHCKKTQLLAYVWELDSKLVLTTTTVYDHCCARHGHVYPKTDVTSGLS